MIDKLTISKLEKIGSNCLNFSSCAIPNAYLYKRDFSGCNFSQANMDNCLITDSILDNA
jgi:uncharacterized protein YjbI with pentapeptide repeats